MAVTLGDSSLLVQQSVYCRVVGLCSASKCAHFAFHCTISTSNTALSVKSGSYVCSVGHSSLLFRLMPFLPKKLRQTNKLTKTADLFSPLFFPGLTVFSFVKIASIAPIDRGKVEQCFRQPVWDCDDRQDRT